MPEGSFYQRSFFGLYADHVFRVCEEQNTQIKSTKKLTIKNPFFNEDAASYLRVHVLPYAPVISRMGFEATGNQIVEDTTNSIEGYHSLLKNNFYDNVSNLRSSRFIRQQAEYIKGLYF